MLGMSLLLALSPLVPLQVSNWLMGMSGFCLGRGRETEMGSE